MQDDIDWITEEFEAVFRDRAVQHDGTKRSCIVPFIDQRERLCTLLDHPAITGVLANLLGDDFNYLGGDGNYYAGDTAWHPDGAHTVGCYAKFALYLDPVGCETGCLRVVPGSHRRDAIAGWDVRQAGESAQLWGIAGRDVPCVALESQPGDVVVFNHNLMHASFGGSAQRRMFTLNCCRRCETLEEIQDLKDYIAVSALYWIDHTHSELMHQTASPERMRHLEQVIEHEGHLPALAAEARATMAKSVLD